jgi:hypothetical protein
VGQKHPELAVERVARGAAGVPAGHPDALFALLLQEAGLVEDERAALFVAQMLDYVLPEVVADRVGIPFGGVFKRRWTPYGGSFSPIISSRRAAPAVLALDRAQSRPTK